MTPELNFCWRQVYFHIVIMVYAIKFELYLKNRSVACFALCRYIQDVGAKRIPAVIIIRTITTRNDEKDETFYFTSKRVQELLFLTV